VNPALSVIFFTTLSGAGYGVLMWLGVWIVMAEVRGEPMQRALLLSWLIALCAASVLIAIGLLSSMLHLGKPGRAWRAFSQWRTSWLSREGVMSIVTYVPVGALLILIAEAVLRERSVASGASLLAALGVITAVCALATVICTAMIYGSLKTIPAWRHRLVVPGYIAFALLTGGALLAAMTRLAGTAETTVQSLAAALAGAAVATAAIKLAYWRAIDAQSLPVTRGDAVGLPDRVLSVFERPHTDENYVTREMAFAVARKHARRLRATALFLFALVPILAAVSALRFAGAVNVALAISGAAAFAGAFVERWLFFAEARHVVTLYY
jgi:DMSO reductase anchor subunit